MAKSKSTTVDRIIEWLKNNKFIAIVLVIGITVIAISQFTKALEEIGSFVGLFKKQDKVDLNSDMQRPDFQGGDSTKQYTPKVSEKRMPEPSKSVSNKIDSIGPTIKPIFRIFIDVGLDRHKSVVYIDGQQAGTAPDSFDVAVGAHELKLMYTQKAYGFLWIYVDTIYVRRADAFWVKSGSFKRKNIKDNQ